MSSLPPLELPAREPAAAPDAPRAQFDEEELSPTLTAQGSPQQYSDNGDNAAENGLSNVLPRNTKVLITGNNRTKASLIGQHARTLKAVGLGGWHHVVGASRRARRPRAHRAPDRCSYRGAPRCRRCWSRASTCGCSATR